MTTTEVGSYTPAWFARRQAAAQRSAEQVLRHVLPLVRPRAVVDIGCGTGSWLAAAKRLGVQEIAGVDGAHVDVRQLEIPEDRFCAVDLATSLRAVEIPDVPPGVFDLALCLEVAEHLPPECDAALVDLLCRLAPVVLFSAAVPHQPGNGHINCRWQSHWAVLFSQHNYGAIDCVRPVFWTDPSVSWWYRQNTVLYVSSSGWTQRINEARRGADKRQWPLDLVHPQHHEYVR